MRRGKCLPACMWRVGEACAVAQLAGQARRQSDELYAMTEVLLHGPEVIAPDGTEASGNEP